MSTLLAPSEEVIAKTNLRPYDRLLQGIRPSLTKVPGRTLEEEADSDRGRILFSAPFRRMQNKAQVFSLESNAAIRSRLSHSLEVSSLGKYIAQQIIAQFKQRGMLAELGLEDKVRPFITFVETACLLHDLGNPPFGHFGERAIGEWFKTNADDFESSFTKRLGESRKFQFQEHYSDLKNFDGNPQGFRIVAQLQQAKADESGRNRGANLTMTQLASMIKYPRSSADANKDTTGRHKGGFFTTESRLVGRIWTELGIQPGTRHPLVYIMEAADDIAYCLSDLEDGVEKGLVSATDLAKVLKKKIKKFRDVAEPQQQEIDRLREVIERTLETKQTFSIYSEFWDLRSAVFRLLVRKAAVTYVERHEAILSGSSLGLFRDESNEKELLSTIKGYAVSKLYRSRQVRSREITAFRVIHGILDAYKPLLLCDHERFEAAVKGSHSDGNDKDITVESALASRFPRRYVDAYRRSLKHTDEFEAHPTVREWSLRAHLVLDYVSGMTDGYALRTYQLIQGMRLEHDD